MRSYRICAATTFPTSKVGHARAISWIVRRTRGSVLAAVEGTSSYGAGITTALVEGGFDGRSPASGRRSGRERGGRVAHHGRDIGIPERAGNRRRRNHDHHGRTAPYRATEHFG
jgi:hypothetical protein